MSASNKEKMATVSVKSKKGKDIVVGSINRTQLLAFSRGARNNIKPDDTVMFPQHQAHHHQAEKILTFIRHSDQANRKPLKMADVGGEMKLVDVVQFYGTITCFKLDPRDLAAEIRSHLFNYVSSHPLTAYDFKLILEGTLDFSLRTHVLKTTAQWLRRGLPVPEFRRIMDFCKAREADHEKAGKEGEFYWRDLSQYWKDLGPTEEDHRKTLDELVKTSDVARDLPNSSSDPLFWTQGFFEGEKEGGVIGEKERRPSL